ncbi:AraC family transcriptional regulator [Ralstonia pseudosolanacearum]|uniref:AraC family transcriptional regulator n=1 Tax=Ralstonia pseudosolanacearum TaxID=1310165 RepID=UPI001FFB31DA|nr:AraC family transcriptional regulator [Ralstonia pseudosolanacearum]
MKASTFKRNEDRMTKELTPLPEALRMLGGLIAAHTPHDGTFDLPVPGVHVMRASRTYKDLVHGVATPCLCLVAQGAKTTLLGTEIYQYDEAKMLVCTIDVPIAAQVVRATPSAPFLCVRLDLDPQRVENLALKASPRSLAKPGDSGAIQVAPPDVEIVNAAARLLRLMQRHKDIELLAPIITDEILMRLLLGPLGTRVAQIAHAQSPLQRINKALAWIRDNFTESMSVDELAASVHMSPSTFHQHFKAVTSLSPLQYQKALRLQEARRLMLAEIHDANGASKAVGYVSPSQFSREYARMFGDAPSRDIAHRREDH